MFKEGSSPDSTSSSSGANPTLDHSFLDMSGHFVGTQQLDRRAQDAEYQGQTSVSRWSHPRQLGY